jgi:aspartate racemase
MKTLGIIGGIAPESTIEYYRRIISSYREEKRDGSYPGILINSIDMKKMLDFMALNDLAGVAEYLLEEIRKLARAGADLGLLASNTPHIVFDDLQPHSPIPLISIVESACAAVEGAGCKKVGLFGTRFTMEGRFYPDVFSRAEITVIIPEPQDQDYIHDKYMGELVHGFFLDKTRERMLEIVDRLIEKECIEGLILGGTELPLLLRDSAGRGIPFFDTTKIHVREAVLRILE